MRLHGKGCKGGEHLHKLNQLLWGNIYGNEIKRGGSHLCHGTSPPQGNSPVSLKLPKTGEARVVNNIGPNK